MTNLSRSGISASELALEALEGALKDANLRVDEIKAVVFSNMLGTTSDGLINSYENSELYLKGQGSVRGHVWLRNSNLGSIPIINVEAACAGGATAFYVACKLAESGLYPVVAIGVEQSRLGTTKERTAWLENALPREEVEKNKLKDPKLAVKSLFMSFNAKWGRDLLRKGLAKIEDFTRAAVKARLHAINDFRSRERTAITIDDVNNSKVIEDPLRLLMCSRFCDGAAACVIDSRENDSSAPIVRCAVQVSGNGSMEYHDRMKQGLDLAIREANVNISDIDVFEVHDATSIEEVYATETLGIFEEGFAAEAIKRGLTSVGTGKPVINPSGGLVGRGHPLGATGLCQIVELTEQLRNAAGKRQVENARLALAVNTGGIIEGDVGACGVAILERAPSR